MLAHGFGCTVYDLDPLEIKPCKLFQAMVMNFNKPKLLSTLLPEVLDTVVMVDQWCSKQQRRLKVSLMSLRHLDFLGSLGVFLDSLFFHDGSMALVYLPRLTIKINST